MFSFSAQSNAARPPLPRKQSLALQIRLEEQLDHKRKSLREWQRKAALGDEQKAELDAEYQQRLKEIREYVAACEQRIQAREEEIGQLEQQLIKSQSLLIIQRDFVRVL